MQGSKIFSDLPMRQKMAIFKEGNSVCRGTKKFQISFYLHKEFSGGAMRQKIAIFKERNSVCRVAIFFQISFYLEKQRLQGSKNVSDLISSKERIFFLEEGRGLF